LRSLALTCPTGSIQIFTDTNMNILNVLALGAVGDHPLEEIAAVDPALHVIDARGVFEVEYAQTWPAETVHRADRSERL
jgi:hypothetical protein